MNPEIQNIAFDAFRRGVYKKNIYYIFDTSARTDEFAYAKAMGGSPAMSAWMIQQTHHRVGVQMQVNKNVSDDLIASDFSDAASVENIPWPAPVVEVYFEDPLLPTILVMKATPQQIAKWVPNVEVNLKREEYITALMQEGNEETGGMLLSLQLAPDMYHTFLTTGQTPSMDTGLMSHPLSDSDNMSMAYMLHLVLKVFAFASIPKYKPQPISRKDMHYGGKPNVKGRPHRPACRVSYMPKVIYTPVAKPATEADREFRGRRGHIHWYRHDRFVNRQGTWDFIAPVVDPHTGKYPARNIIKVRKP